ncbi:Phosphomevalonate kinase [Wickerhamomyces ciferrii]|uniref:Phosphomevalonate kinase n=1 Tax=Wickerhamomyces ciferrii (strain ATCC 14091 / BCRC 22168 / CBS 111 / JCM 3599 / NBRC 0793 / NRRL Y-1031 F-60-10) TaxID=1206466 RepID=K0KH85_WICCF|nr:Phosphomevalonate kinase [Wickerhamomyces ciferrii]CCH40729.1 Phosphomevalonate kinase [Wickerhamomyces ciferrii]
MSDSYKAFSAPGKALIAGGYLVLDRAYNSYVVALSSRMHAVIKGKSSSDLQTTIVKISSPQFANGEWEYELKSDGEQKFHALEINGKKNPFAESAVSTVLAFVNPSIHSHLNITIFSDSGYHSQDETIQKQSGSKKYSYHQKELTQVPKTGLGSSAGLVTVLTTAIYSYYNTDFDVKSKTQLQLIHNIAQVAHCQAQGKVGSGFDVAAATFGSIVYKRFDPSLINNLKPQSDITKSQHHEQLVKLVKFHDWDIKNDKVALPKGIKLIMGDIKGGSNTPKLVSKVLQWRQSDPESAQVYHELDSSNMKYVESLDKLNKFSETNPDEYENLINFIINNNTTEILNDQSTPNLEPIKELINATNIIRSNFRSITSRSGAEIEPEPQTKLLDECSQIKGVISGVVPGAGGYDAISLLVAEESIDNLIGSTKTNPIFQNVSWLDLHEQSDGIQQEPVENYIELL